MQKDYMTEIKNEYIWCKKNIKAGKNIFFYFEMFQKGIKYVILSNIMAFNNLCILNSREILICYGRKQPMSKTLMKTFITETRDYSNKRFVFRTRLTIWNNFEVKNAYDKSNESKINYYFQKLNLRICQMTNLNKTVWKNIIYFPERY